MRGNPQRPWHVAHVIGSLRTGGAERQLVNYLLAADRDEFRHTAVCLQERGELAAVVEAAGIPVVRIPIRTRHAVGSLRRFAGWLRDQDVAVVHAHMHDSALWGRLAGRWAGVPVLMTTEHGKELWKGPLRVAIDHHLSRWTARHIAVARDGMEIRIRRERFDPGKLILIPNGVPIPAEPGNDAGRRRVRAEFGLADDTPVLGTVGRVVEAKGYEHLLAALVALRETRPRLRWLAVGDGDRRSDLTARAAAAGLGDAVIWAGRRDDVNDLLAAMDVWVMSSVREGLPVALLEAMAACRPIVATNVGGIPDAVRDGSEGLLVPPADPAALAAAIAQLLADPTRAAGLAAAARRRAQADYGIGSVARRIEDVYRQELLKTTKGRAGS
ncbi:MAG: glycosyltransferase [bacterium]|nr:glycosyltransferase [bacterium]